MGPRIILRGAIPSDSYIGGFGHRPLFLRVVASVLVFVVLCLLFLCAVLVSLFVLASWLFGILKVVLQMSFPSWVKLALSWSYGTTVASHGTIAGVVCSVRAQLHPMHGTTISIMVVIFYCRWKSGTTVLRAVLPLGAVLPLWSFSGTNAVDAVLPLGQSRA